MSVNNRRLSKVSDLIYTFSDFRDQSTWLLAVCNILSTERDVLKGLQNLDPYKSAGLENLDHLFLKLSAAIVATPITSLFNLSFVSSEISKDWKAPLQRGMTKLLHTYIHPALPI